MVDADLRVALVNQEFVRAVDVDEGKLLDQRLVDAVPAIYQAIQAVKLTTQETVALEVTLRPPCECVDGRQLTLVVKQLMDGGSIGPSYSLTWVSYEVLR